MKQHSPHFHLKQAGICTAMELAIRFAKWCDQRNNGILVQDIQDEFEVSRATAYRWLNAYRAANGIATAA